MSQRSFTILRYLLALTFLCSYKIAYCQVRNPNISAYSLKKAGVQKPTSIETDQFEKLEKAIGGKEALQQTQQQLLLLKQRAIKAHDDIMLARSLFELMKIRDLRTEDTLYFENSAFMDTLLSNTATSPQLIAIMHVLHAQRINNFDHRSLRFNAAAYRSKNIPVDYAELTTNQRDSIWTQDLSTALAYHPRNNDAKKLLWLSYNPDVFLFDPQFADIVLSEYVTQTALKNYYNFNYGTAANLWPSLPSTEFRYKLDSIAKNDKGKSVLSAYNRWLSYNKANNAIAGFIESLARKYIFSFTSADSLSHQTYINYLLAQRASPYPTVKAHFVYQLCLIWNEDGNKYFNNPFGYQYFIGGTFNKKYQYLPDSALRLFEKNKALMSSYLQFNNILTLMADQIEARGLSITMDNKFIPNESIPIKVFYKNTDTLYYRIIRINSGELSGHLNITSTPQLMSRKPVKFGFFALPLPADHNKHAVYLKLSPLPAGRYRLLFNYAELKSDGRSIYNIPFDVTSIAAINSDERIYVVDRKTGTPLSGAAIRAFKKDVSVVDKVPATVKKEGYIIIPDGIADSINIAYKEDTLGYSFVVHDNNKNNDDNIYDKDEYDNLGDFYDDKLTMQVFTDRGIYRPGQTVHYKIILLTRNPQTGNPILFDKQNLGRGLSGNHITDWLKKNHSLVTLTDPFNHKVDSAQMVLNDFGSFAGSFILPKTAATGEWDIDGKLERDYQNEGRFRVEEYKRPTIELSMEKQKKMLRPGEPFTVKLKLRSFSGGDLGNIPIKYTINRSGVLPERRITRNVYNNYIDTKLSDTVVYTNEKGELSIPVNDTLLTKYKWGDNDADNYNYSLNATAIDATGETSEINESVNISSRPLKISIQLNKIYDRQALPTLSVNTSADFEGTVGRMVYVKIYTVNDPALVGNSARYTDQWYYPESDWNKWFPVLAYTKPAELKRTLVIDTIINTMAYEKLTLPKQKLNSGFYELTADCRADDQALVGHSTYNFKVFDSGSGSMPDDNLDYMPVNTAKPGKTITWYNSNKADAYTIYQVLYQSGKKKVIKNIYSEVTEHHGLYRWTYPVPADATSNLVFTRIYVSDNQIIKNNKTVYLYKAENAQPEIIIEKYRKVMVPGAKETFTLSVKTKNANTAAELMTTLYDASLDKLNEHAWKIPNQHEYHLDPKADWIYSLTQQQQTGDFNLNDQQVVMREVATRPGGYFSALNGKVAGVNVTSAQGLNEVVVVGYGSQVKRYLAGSAVNVMIRGTSSLSDYQQPLIIVDGEIYTGGLDKLNPGAITQAIVLKGADASALYGARAAEGVLIISTKSPIILPDAQTPVAKIRKKFNETAFFFPQVHAGTDGYYSFSFTMPESATEWNWKVLAHTQKTQFVYLERKLQTQLNLMVQPNMPRLLYQGDKLKLQSRITNLDTVDVAGTITCKIEDAVTGDDITFTLLANNKQAFSINKKSSTASAFILTVPDRQLNPLKIVITASTPGTADAEEHIIPVLSPKILVRQSMAVKFDKQSAITIRSIKLPPDAQLFGIGLSIVQKPQATLINALPWLANYSYDCAEQTFNKLSALAVALRLMQKDTLAQRMFKKASQSIEKEKAKNDPLPDQMAAEAIPWLNLGNQTAIQQKQLFKVLDTSVSKNSIDLYLQRLYKLQQPGGGLAWFDGGKSNEYISAYILAGFGRLKQQGWKLSIGANVRFRQFISDLYKYNEGKILKSDINNYDAYQLYALSYWLTDQDASKILTGHVNPLLNEGWKDVDKKPLDQQAVRIINIFRYNTANSTLYQKAQQQLENINQLAIQDNENGLRWKDISDAEELNTSSEETMALLTEAFALSGKYPEINTGMVKWLLSTRQDQHWQTTKATAAAIDMLQKEKGNVIGENKSFSTELAGQHFSVSDDLLNGVSSAFSATKQLPAAIPLQQQGANTNGALTWYYFAKPASLDTLNKAVHISKQFYSYDKIKGWIPLTNERHLKTGDKVHVKLTIETASRLKFVHISDPRAAAFESADNNSGYQYDDGLSYYRSVKDTGLEIFTESVPRGISEISYELIVAMDGEFTCGPARLQCMYQPSVTAYSTAQKIMINL